MEISVWILLVSLTLLLFVAHMSHPTCRRFLREGFAAVDYKKPSVDLTTEPDFMTFYKFHLSACELWDAILEEVMKNECADPAVPCPAKATYINKLAATYREKNPGACFINCEKKWDAKSSLADLLEAVPENISCYRDTLEYIVSKSTEIIKQVTEAMERIPSYFTDYQATVICKTDKTGKTQCTDDKGAIYTPQAPVKGGDEQAALQLKQTNTIIGRCRVMATEIPELKDLIAQAKENVGLLKEVQKKAKDGTLLPAPAKT
jgi:hypothetical protein